MPLQGRQLSAPPPLSYAQAQAQAHLDGVVLGDRRRQRLRGLNVERVPAEANVGDALQRRQLVHERLHVRGGVQLQPAALHAEDHNRRHFSLYGLREREREGGRRSWKGGREVGWKGGKGERALNRAGKREGLRGRLGRDQGRFGPFQRWNARRSSARFHVSERLRGSRSFYGLRVRALLRLVERRRRTRNEGRKAVTIARGARQK